jgi:hypothetical protein
MSGMSALLAKPDVVLDSLSESGSLTALIVFKELVETDAALRDGVNGTQRPPAACPRQAE